MLVLGQQCAGPTQMCPSAQAARAPKLAWYHGLPWTVQDVVDHEAMPGQKARSDSSKAYRSRSNVYDPSQGDQGMIERFGAWMRRDLMQSNGPECVHVWSNGCRCDPEVLILLGLEFKDF